jgi:hypothetical protein
LLDIWLPVAHQTMNVLLLCGLGLTVGFLAGFFGVGGGIIMTPLLMAVGVPPSVAVGSGLTVIVGASISGTVRHTQLGNVDYKLALLLLVGSFVGVQIGAHALGALKGAAHLSIHGHSVDAAYFVLTICYLALLFVIGATTLFESGSSRSAALPHGTPALALWFRGLSLPPYVSLKGSGVDRFPFLVILPGGLLAGVMAGLLGVGGGIIMVPFMMYFMGLRAQRAVGTSLCQICFTAAVGAASHALHGNVDPVLALVILTASLAGARLGASTTSHVKSLHLRRYFGLFAMVVGVLVLISFIREVLHSH